MDYEALRRAWIKQGYDLPIVAREDSVNKQAKDGRSYTIIPPLEYKNLKDRVFSDTNTIALINEALNKSRFKEKKSFTDKEDFMNNAKDFKNTKPIINIFPQWWGYLGNEICDIDPKTFSRIIDKLRKEKEERTRRRSALEILRLFSNIVVSEIGIITCAPEYHSLLSLPVVDLKQQRRCPVKRCTHGRKCIIESQSYTGELHIRGEQKGLYKAYSLIAKECIKTKQPYIAEVNFSATFVFDYLFNLNKRNCPLCDSDNNHFIPEKKTLKDFRHFKCDQCGNEFVIYDGGWKFQGFDSYLNRFAGEDINVSYLIGCKILGLTPALLKKYKEICWSSNKDEVTTFLKNANIKYRKKLPAILNEEISKIESKFNDKHIYNLLKEYDCISAIGVFL